MMKESINYKLKVDFLISNNSSNNNPSQSTLKQKFKKCKECNKEGKNFNEIYQTCYQCYKEKISSGNKVIDDFIKYTITNCDDRIGRMEFVPFDKFEDVEFIAEGGYSKIYKATWINDPITSSLNDRNSKTEFVLKKLNNSKNISSKELNELKIFSNFKSFSGSSQDHISYGHYNHINLYYGITQDPMTKDYMVIMKYYESRDLTHYITEDFFNISCYEKLCRLCEIISGLKYLHDANIIHKDYHSGNIFITKDIYIVNMAIIGDLGINKSAIDDNEIYGIIPYVAPEIFRGQKYSKASDIYSFGMIMWELMTGRKPFWDRNHDAELIIDICDGLRPSFVKNVYEVYMKLIQECWDPNQDKRPTAAELYKKIYAIKCTEFRNCLNENPTKIVESSDIGPIKTYNSGAIYISRPLSGIIKSAESIKNLKIPNMISDKRGYEDNQIEDNKIIKKTKSFVDEDNDYLMKDRELDNFSESNNNDYITEEINFDI